MTGRVLVVDDEDTARRELCDALADDGLQVRDAGDGLAALELIANDSFDVCVTDIRMPGMNGIELLEQIATRSPETSVIVTTAFGEVATAIEALRLGASDYVLKPLLFEDVLAKVQRLIEHRALRMEVRNLRRAVHAEAASLGMVGTSEPMEGLRALIGKVAAARSPVLVTGESGTGKELVALAIHAASSCALEPFVPINCAAIPEQLLESELFGHVKGSFTGAVANKEGLLKTAGAGTIFLDEIGDMPVALQVKLLRALQSRQIQPVGSVRQIPIEARVIAATNKNLQEAIAGGTFREDLYYRLAVVEIEVPPLRERRTDVPLLVDHFLRKLAPELGRKTAAVSNEALLLLVGYEWKGNIRELENVIERAMIVSESELIVPDDLPRDIRESTPVDPDTLDDLKIATRRFEQGYVRRALRHCGGDKERAADVLGISLSSLYRKLEDS